MKICAIICEYNPFHNGHKYHIEQAKALSNADYVVCIMSGNFVQRGEAAIMEKHLRAKHALSNGADAVIELPVHFSTSNAELFAKGAIKLINAIPNVTHLCFGSESGTTEEFLSAAKILNNEPIEVSKKIKELSQNGFSYAKARHEAFSSYINSDLMLSPNNLLGIEYTRALLSSNSNIQILPIQRIGAGYSELETKENYSSASAMRKAILEKNISALKSNLPKAVYNDLDEFVNINLTALERYAVLSTTKEELAQALDCTEGLENAFINAAINETDLITALTSARYTSSRIRRIALQNLLKIREHEIREALRASLFLRVLGVKNRDILSTLGKSSYPLIVKNSDTKKLEGVAKQVFLTNEFADKIYAIASEKKYKNFNPLL